MNEHQLTIGECTDLAKVHPEPEPGKRIFYSSELSRVALERTKTSREAVKLMGGLIETYGYYGTGETLLVGDPNESWVMEMAGCDMDGSGGVWVAQRVPDDKIFVAANQFRIREIDPNSPDIMFSKNIFEIAEKKGWWKPSDGKLDFAKVYGDGEFHHPYYSLRRVWRAMSLLAPSLGLSPWAEDAFTKDYPFAVKPDKKVTVEDIAAIHRDNYDGTEFDLTVGLAAGPFGNPTRYEGNAESVADSEGKLTTLVGEFERPLDIYRCVYSYVAQSAAGCPMRSEESLVRPRQAPLRTHCCLHCGWRTFEGDPAGKHTGPEDGQRMVGLQLRGELLHDKVVVYDKGHKGSQGRG